MSEIGVRELKQKTSEIIRKVREERAAYDVTYRGRVVARIVPVGSRTYDRDEAMRIWREMDKVAERISKKWPKGLSAADAVAEQRR